MTEKYRVVVIGGGVVGCSILYHLAKAGWRDLLLIERQELTSGSSWHAAGGLFTITRPNAVAEIHKYTLRLYPELEKESGQSCGYHFTGGLNLCRSPLEVDSMTAMQGACRRLGLESHFISLEEAKARAPILETGPILAALWEEEGGHVDPASATQAFAAAARKSGAEIERFNPVLETNPLPDGRWQVVTEKRTLKADYLVNAAGLWGREVAKLAGITLPLMPVEHHYLVTETVPEIEELDFELPQINDGEINGYARQEGQGLLFGAYETPCRHWAAEGTPQDFGHELLPDDLARMEWHIEKAIEVMPCLGSAGVKRVINGPMIFSPDLGPLLGPHPALTNYFCANGVMTGFNQGAGIGMVLAQWIMEGEPPFDIFCWDVARYGEWAGRDYVKATTRFFYEHRSDAIVPYQEFEVGRPLESPPIYEALAKEGAVFGMSFGLEHPLWFATGGRQAADGLTFRRPNWWQPVAEEGLAIREAAGLMEFSAMAKFEVTGAGARAWLDRLMAGRLPKPGRMALSPMLNESGKLIGDFSISCLGSDRFLVLGADVMQLSFERYFRAQAGEGASVENKFHALSGLHLAGPKAREILSEVVQADLSNGHFPFMAARELEVSGIGPVTVLRVSFTGELGYELYCARAQQPALFAALHEAGRPHGLRLVGTRALMMTRLEKGFPAWGTELSPDYTPWEAGLSRHVALDKGDFIGRDAAAKAKEAGPREVRVAFTVDLDGAGAQPHCDAKNLSSPDTLAGLPGGLCLWGDEAIFRDGAWVGYVSSGGYGPKVGRHIALAYIRADALDAGSAYEIEILGRRCPAHLAPEPLYDPKGERMRG